RLVAVSLDRRTPIGGDMQLRQRTLHTDGAGRQIDSPYIRRHTAGEALATYQHISAQQAHIVQSGKNLFWRDNWGTHCSAYSGPEPWFHSRTCSIHPEVFSQRTTPGKVA